MTNFVLFYYGYTPICRMMFSKIKFLEMSAANVTDAMNILHYILLLHAYPLFVHNSLKQLNYISGCDYCTTSFSKA